MRSLVIGLIVVASGCSSEPDNPLGGELLADGFIRYTVAPVRVAAGETAQYVQWVSPPLDRDFDVVEVRGSQSVGGHHAILYASPDIEPVGTTRKWLAADQITSRFLGGAGGEGSSSATAIPPGSVLRVPKGSGFYIQSHYLNASDEAIEGTSTIDVKLTDPSPDVTVLSMFVSSTLGISVPPGATEQALVCDVLENTQLILYFNHTHETGTSVTTELRGTGGSAQIVKADPQWNVEWTTKPNFQIETLSQPLMLPAGSQLVTRCDWDNPSTKTLGFPNEMCAFFGFYIGTNDRACADGNWVNL